MPTTKTHFNKTQGKFEALVRLIKKHYLLSDKGVIKIALAGVVAHYFDTDPLWIFLIAPPSSMKTELISALDDITDVYQLSSLTPQTLFSGLRKRKDQTKDNALLTRVGNKILTLKDFGGVLSMRRDDRAIVLAQLREIYDGTFHAKYGNGVEVDWKGRIGFVAGVTPAIDTFYSVFQILGERFIQYRLNPIKEKALGGVAINNLGEEKSARQEIKEYFKTFFNQLKIPSIKDLVLPEDIKMCLVNLACFCVRARSGVVRDHYRKTVEYIPEPEAPARLAKQLATLTYTLAVLEGRKEIELKDYLLALKCGLDCIPRQRMAVLNFLASEDREFKTTEVAEAIDYSSEGARRHLEDLVAHKLIKVKKLGAPHPDTWKLSKRTQKYMAGMLPAKPKKALFKNIKKGLCYKHFLIHLLNVPPEGVRGENNTIIPCTHSKYKKNSAIDKQNSIIAKSDKDKLVQDMSMREIEEIFQ